MARKNPRYRNEHGDRAGSGGAHNLASVLLHDLRRPLRPFTPSWSELAVTAVAVMCAAPALVVGFLLLLEAALPSASRCGSANAANVCTAEAADAAPRP
jgi:hypothetical protein